MSGWIKLHRDILEHKIFKSKPIGKGEAWIRLILMASYKDSDFFVNDVYFSAKRGQILVSQRTISDEFGWSQNKLKRFLNWLKSERMIDYETNTRLTIITICNYSKYQSLDNDDGRTESAQTNDQKAHGKRTESARMNDIQEYKEIKEGKETKDIRANALVKITRKNEISEIFDYWKIATGHIQSQLLDKRKRLIQKTLDGGYTAIQIKLAIDGHKKSTWHKTNGFDGIEYSLKPENIDKFIKMAGMTNDELTRNSGKLTWGDWEFIC